MKKVLVISGTSYPNVFLLWLLTIVLNHLSWHFYQMTSNKYFRTAGVYHYEHTWLVRLTCKFLKLGFYFYKDLSPVLRDPYYKKQLRIRIFFSDMHAGKWFSDWLNSLSVFQPLKSSVNTEKFMLLKCYLKLQNNHMMGKDTVWNSPSKVYLSQHITLCTKGYLPSNMILPPKGNECRSYKTLHTGWTAHLPNLVRLKWEPFASQKTCGKVWRPFQLW